MISSSKSTISFLFRKTPKNKGEKLMLNFYSNYKGQIDNLRKEIENKND